MNTGLKKEQWLACALCHLAFPDEGELAIHSQKVHPGRKNRPTRIDMRT